ncbi:MAG: hypothetical protein K6T88_06680 [Bacillus sp. (in: Bacteria)]|nr:hypothetical protein [Bacillus sp. (in: firmicutes)]
MFELLVDNSDINALTALYVSIYIGITLKVLWAWNVEYSFIDSISNPADTKIIHPLVFYRKKCSLNGNFILKRIVKYIRRKDYSPDDSEDPISFLVA